MGPGLWKLNLAILEEDEYVSLITDFWFYWQRCQSGFSTLTRWWDAGKSHIKCLSINYCKNRIKSKSTERNILLNLAAHLKTHVDSGRLSLLPVYLSTLSRLDALDREVARGAQVRARARWAEEGESSTKYFFRLEKKRATDRYISALRAGDDSLVPAALLSLDQEKQFDRVDWSFFRSTLYALGFGQSFVGWVDLFYYNSCSAVNVNGYISSFFSLSRGVRQGCPLSPLIYILVPEVLACNLRASSSISGLLLPHSPSPCLVSRPMPMTPLLSLILFMPLWPFSRFILCTRRVRVQN